MNKTGSAKLKDKYYLVVYYGNKGQGFLTKDDGSIYAILDNNKVYKNCRLLGKIRMGQPKRWVMRGMSAAEKEFIKKYGIKPTPKQLEQYLRSKEDERGFSKFVGGR